MPNPVHRIGIRVEARPDELWTLGQAIRYVRDRNITWARLAPPFLAGHIPTPEGQRAFWALWRDLAAGAVFSPEDIRDRGIVNPSPLTPDDREAIFDLWRELAARAVRAIQNFREVRPSHWSLEIRLALSVLEKQGETTGDSMAFIAEVERMMGDMLFPALELIRAFPRRAPFQLAQFTETVEPSPAPKVTSMSALSPAKATVDVEPYSYDALVSFFEGLVGSPGAPNREAADLLARDHFKGSVISNKILAAARRGAGFAGTPGPKPKR